MANIFVKEFAKVFTHTNEHDKFDPKTLFAKEHLTEEYLHNYQVTTEDVTKAIRSFKANRSTGPDGLSADVCKNLIGEKLQ